jgi:hypothetical protein
VISGVTDRGVTRALENFLSRTVGRFSWPHCSTSSASLVQVRAMSSRMPWHSHVGCALSHLTAFSGAISASFRRQHGNAPHKEHRIDLPKNKTPPGGAGGV